MNTSTLGLFLRQLALSGEVRRLSATSDRDLLAVYEIERGQAAFTELMRRHGPMVLRTCRRVLGHSPDAEDAFQATFVLLARKAGQLRREAAAHISLGGWLHHVAYQTAVKVLRGAVRRRDHERQASAMTHPDRDPSTEATWNEIEPILDVELDALPDEARRLLIACYLQEKTYTEAAAELGLPRGSMARRLEKARALLAARLARRGITVSASLLAVLLGESAKGAGVPAVLLVHTLEAARTFGEQATGMVSANVAQLVKDGLAKLAKGSLYLKLCLALGGLVLLVGATASLTVALVGRPAAEPPAALPPVNQAPATRQAAPIGRKVADPETAAPIAGTTVLVRGKVLDVAGQVIPFAAVTALVRGPFWPCERDEIVARGQADEQGVFRLRVPADFPTWFPERQVVLVAKASGNAPFATSVRVAEQGATDVDLRLTTAEGVVRGRLLAPDGSAAPGVRLRVISLGDVTRESVQGVAEQDEQGFGWPGPVVSDAEGRFALSGIDPKQEVWLQVEDERYAPSAFGPRGTDKQVEIRLKPAQVLESRIIAADTGKPLAGGKLIARFAGVDLDSMNWIPVSVAEPGSSKRCFRPMTIDGVTGTDGRLPLRTPVWAKMAIEVHPPIDSPYLAVCKKVDWSEGMRQSLAVALPRGVVVRGRVVDDDGRPVAGASVQYSSPAQGNPAHRPEVIPGHNRIVLTGKDGRFHLTVPAGPVQLRAYGPTHEYRTQTLRSWSLLAKELEHWGWREPLPAERRSYTHAQEELKLTLAEHSSEVWLRLVRGETVAGRVMSPDGAPVETAVLLCTEKVSPLLNGAMQPLRVRAGRYELPGCVAGQVYPVLLFDAVNGWGAAVDLMAGLAAPPEVKLARCGSARLRLLDAKGRPLARRGLRLVLLTERSFPASEPPQKRETDRHNSSAYDPRHYRTNPVSDPDGWLTLPALIPGARYVLQYADVAGVLRNTPEFQVEPGEQLLLPELAIRDR